MADGSGRVGCMGNGWGSSPGWNGASLSMTNDEVATDHGRDVRRGALQVVQGTRQRYYDCGDRDYPGAQHVLILRGQRVQRRALCCAGAVSACAPSTFSYKR